MSWFASKRAARFLVGAMVWALVWWLAVGAALYPPSFAGSDRFIVVSLHADYVIHQTSDNGTWMEATETIVVVHPPDSQVRSFDRVLPTIIAGRRTAVTILSATVDWVTAPVDTQEGLTQVRATIGSPTGAALVGQQHTYQLTYLYSDVLTVRDGRPQLSWNINGHGWREEIGSVSATITFDHPLANRVTRNARCSVGTGRSAQPCSVERTALTLVSSRVRVGPHQSQTVVVELRPKRSSKDELRGPPLATPSRVWLVLVLLLVGMSAYTAMSNLRLAATQRRRALGHDAVAVQFAPPGDLQPMLAAALVGFPGRGLVAELLRAARERHVTLSGGGDTDTPLTAELVSWPEQNWSNASQDALKAVFGSKEPGTTVNVAATIAAMPAKEVTELRDLAPSYELVSSSRRSDSVTSSIKWLLVAAAVLIPGVITSGRLLNLPFWWVVIPVLVLVVSLAVHYGLVLRWNELTDKGREATRYLEGLKKFLTTSEAERMRAVQGERISPQWGPEQRISIFEKLLPYAVVLGVEDSWQQAVGSDLEVRFDWLPAAGASGQGWGLADSWAYNARSW